MGSHGIIIISIISMSSLTDYSFDFEEIKFVNFIQNLGFY